MGSLVAGWDSPASDPKFVRNQRNSSLTNEEIEAYWKSKKAEEEHLKAISTKSDSSHESTPEGTDEKLEGNLMDINTETSSETLNKQNAWWTRSNWAFLNEAPVIASSEGRFCTKHRSV